MSMKARFLPWARRSMLPDTALLITAAGRDVKVPVSQYGPGDVTGLMPDMIRRRDPSPGSLGMPPNLFASIEFTRPDLPWRLTPGPPDAGGNLQPWLALIVVDAHSGNPLGQIEGAKLPVIEVPRSQLPVLSELTLWAHVQVDADAQMSEDVAARGIARLIAPRALAPNTRYLACLVPSYEAGRLAALGQAVPDPRSSAPAWTAGAGNVVLPVYDSWLFTTTDSGDLETLARRLRGRDLSSTSQPKKLDVTLVSGAVEGHLAPIEGAFRPLGPEALWSGPAVEASSQQLRHSLARSTEVGLPIYGSTASGKDQVAPGWLEQLNLDPRRRAAAGLGVEMVRAHQEDLVDEAWRQAGDIHRARREREGAVLAEFAANRLHARVVAPLREAHALITLTPALARLHDGAGSNVAARVAASTLPQAALSSAFRRLVASKTPPAARRAGQGMVSTLAHQNAAVLSPGALPPTPVKLVTTTQLRNAARSAAGAPDTFHTHVALTDVQRRIVDTALPQRLARRVAVVDVIRPKPLAWPTPPPLTGPVTATARFHLRVTFGDGARVNANLGVQSTPRFTQPLAAWLDPAFLLAGVDLPPDTAGLLEVNSAFVEAIMIGANHELGRELLWRGIPLDRASTLLTRFFETRVSSAPRDMISIATWDGSSALGSHLATGERTVLVLRSRLVTHLNETAIFLAKAEPDGAFRRPGTTQVLPLFRGLAGLDTAYFGFDVKPEDLASDPGWYIVIQELAGAVRFGLDESGPEVMNTWNDLAWPMVAITGGYIAAAAKQPKPLQPKGLVWGTDGAQMAGIVLQRPVRLSIHTSLLLPEKR